MAENHITTSNNVPRTLSPCEVPRIPLREFDLNVNLFEEEIEAVEISQFDERQRILTEIFGEEDNTIEGLFNQENENLESLSMDNRRPKICLSDEQRKIIYNMLLQKSTDGKLKKYATKEVASSLSVHIRTVQRIWKQGKESETADVSRRVRNCGRKRIQLDLSAVREIPLHRRTTLRSLSSAINVSTSTLYKHLQYGDIRRHSNAIKPFLKEENKKSRLRFCLSQLDTNSIPHDPIFSGMYNTVHIDEKWFYMTKKCESYYLLSDEEDPLRTCTSKNFIGKVMFLVALARPRFDVEGNEIFSGKIGVFPFVTQEPAKRSSINRPAGTMETKPITSVNREVIKNCLIEKVLPAIREKWPRNEVQQPIYIQQDNAKTHISEDDVEFRQAATQDGFDIRLICQPANSPDLNVLDLGFFAAIQSLQYKESPSNVDELIDAVLRSFEAFPTVKSNYIFLSLQLCMVKIMKLKDSQHYKIPHINKSGLQRRDELPHQIKCDPRIVQEVLCYLEE